MIGELEDTTRSPISLAYFDFLVWTIDALNREATINSVFRCLKKSKLLELTVYFSSIPLPDTR
ncbi:hypothetical protein [Gloeocapsopsis sp. IPPAS B-1203]|uniref:hypothetical protein n=1 Tax=Gloeocapsopsis sp. IPPAS B-1203 TaxID=2049454 RepID=UPI00117E1A67|nr:hypothetical protein [Gloeocapsopsis sp. IPPAS B-1203]